MLILASPLGLSCLPNRQLPRAKCGIVKWGGVASLSACPARTGRLEAPDSSPFCVVDRAPESSLIRRRVLPEHLKYWQPTRAP